LPVKVLPVMVLFLAPREVSLDPNEVSASPLPPLFLNRLPEMVHSLGPPCQPVPRLVSKVLPLMVAENSEREPLFQPVPLFLKVLPVMTGTLGPGLTPMLRLPSTNQP